LIVGIQLTPGFLNLFKANIQTNFTANIQGKNPLNVSSGFFLVKRYLELKRFF